MPIWVNRKMARNFRAVVAPLPPRDKSLIMKILILTCSTVLDRKANIIFCRQSFSLI
jgi:hypothetical protein